ncbi:MAG: hypothetical protein F6K24_54790 [Okeania sp. SIO2D1]|nr:hypothetical protein [Okeania sp. SIO2D1]
MLNIFYQGDRLRKINKYLPEYLDFSQKNNHLIAQDCLSGLSLILEYLTDSNPEVLTFKTQELSETQFLANCQERKTDYALCHYYILKAQVLYWHEKTTQALSCLKKAEVILNVLNCKFQVAVHNFYTSLCLANLYPQASIAQQHNYLQKIIANQKQMKVWQDNCPANFQNMYLLVAAEMARVQDQNWQAIELYEQAIATAKADNFSQNEALANELTARFWLEKNRPEVAEVYLKKAHYGYSVWQAWRKVKQLENNYPQYFNKLASALTNSVKRQTIVNSTTSSRLGAVFDLATVMKASQAIAGEIILDKLLVKLIKILLENTGAQSWFLK